MPDCRKGLGLRGLLQTGRKDKRPPTDIRRQRKQHERQLVIAAIFLLVVVGDALIGLFIGPVEMLTALPCLLGGAGAILGLYLLLGVVERWIDR